MSDVPDVPESTAQCPPQRMQRQLAKQVFPPAAAASGSNLSILAAQSPFANYPESALPFPLNLPPSYPVYRDLASAPQQRRASVTSSQGALLTPGRVGKNANPNNNASSTSVITRPASTSSAVKGKRTLDAFMQSRQTAQSQTESSGSDSETSLRSVGHISFFMIFYSER